VRVSAESGQHAEWLHEYVELGVDAVYCFNVNREQRPFIETFGARVIPALRAGATVAR
jgi:hypothetical protein